MKRAIIALLATVVTAAACGNDPAANVSAPTADPDSTRTEVAPTELALAEVDVSIEGPAHVVVAPGGSITVAYRLANGADANRSLATVVRSDVAEVVADVSPASVRLDSGSSSALTATISVDAGVAIGDTTVIELVAANVEDTTQRDSLEIEVEVGTVDGSAPDIGDDRAVIATNQQVVLYVVSNDPDPDGDIDPTSLRLVGGGGLAAQVMANADGTVVYEPFSNLVGTDVVLYELCDLAGNCDTGAITVNIG